VWNFHKILIGKHGEATQAFGPRTEPEAAEITAAIDKAL
jgi:glutathione peroxidase